MFVLVVDGPMGGWMDGMVRETSLLYILILATVERLIPFVYIPAVSLRWKLKLLMIDKSATT